MWTLLIPKLLYIVLHERHNNTAYLAGHLKFQEKSAFAHSLWVNCSKSKQKLPELGHYIQFEIAIYRVLHERNNITACFPEHPKFKDKKSFTHLRLVNSGKSKYKITRIWALYILILPYTRCSTKEAISVPSWST